MLQAATKRLVKLIRYTKKRSVTVEEAAKHLNCSEKMVMAHVKQDRHFFLMSHDGVSNWVGAYEPKMYQPKMMQPKVMQPKMLQPEMMQPKMMKRDRAKEEMVLEVKALQRDSLPFRRAWEDHCMLKGEGWLDPDRHTRGFLAVFLDKWPRGGEGGEGGEGVSELHPPRSRSPRRSACGSRWSRW